MKCCGVDEIKDPQKKAFNDRLTAVGWALFLVMIGCLLLVPEGRIPETAWLIGVGLIMLGVNGVRCLVGIKMDGFGVALGAIVLAIGIGGLFGVELPIFPIILIIIGLNIIIGPLFKKK